MCAVTQAKRVNTYCGHELLHCGRGWPAAGHFGLSCLCRRHVHLAEKKKKGTVKIGNNTFHILSEKQNGVLIRAGMCTIMPCLYAYTCCRATFQWQIQLFFAVVWHWRLSNCLQAKDKTAITPPPFTKTPPLHLKSKQPKWLDEIRATLLAVKLNRICACWFEDLHTILSTLGGGAETKYTAQNDLWQ